MTWVDVLAIIFLFVAASLPFITVELLERKYKKKKSVKMEGENEC
jgi:hypothetical protein